jgi:hypothetical protein
MAAARLLAGGTGLLRCGRGFNPPTYRSKPSASPPRLGKTVSPDYPGWQADDRLDTLMNEAAKATIRTGCSSALPDTAASARPPRHRRASLLPLAVLGGGLAAGHAVAATFGDDLTFLRKHTDVLVLSDPSGAAQVAVVPAYQGRVMTSTAGGAASTSFGWINRELIASGKFLPHMNAFGGEDRFWLGPEGGQFAVFFEKGVPFDLEHWFTPAPIDTEPFQLVRKDPDRAEFRRAFTLTNYSGTRFEVQVDREVKLLTPAQTWKHLGVAPEAGVTLVSFESVNRVTNQGRQPWTKDTGLLSIWILGMFTPSPGTTVVVPIRAGPESALGKPVNADYFGRVPADRLVVKDGAVFFSGDGRYRSKIGFNPRRAKPILGSYDAVNQVLTLAQYTLPAGVTDYVNSMWEMQKEPFAGDAANSYNDGPPSPGAKPLGPFYEIESSSPAAALAPGKSLEHVHRTIHLRGPEAKLDALARATLGVGLKDIMNALPKPAGAR